VHRSNFVQMGFVAEVGIAELSGLGVPVVVDLGSGAIGEISGEPVVSSAIAAGAKVVTFSGDKLLGGPQAGILVGDRACLATIGAHPLMRAVRPDKMTLAALEATLEIHREGRAAAELPALAALSASSTELKARAEKLRAACGVASVTVIELSSAVGGGALPTVELPSWGVALDGMDPRLADRVLRSRNIVARILDDRLVLDVRSILGDDELEECARALAAI
jgi:L-seryl-tRNA(Ser) seleniumtransferase